MRMSVAAAAAALIGLSAAPAVAGGCCYGGYGYGGYGYGYGRYVAEIDYTYDAPPPVVFRMVPVPVPTAQPVLIVNQGPTFVPTVTNYVTPTVTYEYPRVFPYGSSGYGPRYAYKRHYHRHRHRHDHMPMPGYK
jgi:hypothetical protein